MRLFLPAIAALSVSLSGCTLAAMVDEAANASFQKGPYEVSEHARALHDRLLVADLHADTLLWNREMDERHAIGHVDLPRMEEGNVGLQAFTIVSKVPSGINERATPDRDDMITFLAMAQGWPAETWGVLHERTLYQARRLHEVEKRSNGRFRIIRTADDLRRFIEDRKADPKLSAGFLGIEGAHALSGNLRNVLAFHDAGIRMMAPTHFFDNDIAGSQHGMEKGGLTDKGRRMIKLMEAKKMIVDLAHASEKTIAEVTAMATRPVVVSHTGVRGTCENNRNLTDKQVRDVARTGGVIGIAYFPLAICGEDATAVAKAIRYTADLVGVEHVALGSDYDGFVKTPFDTSGVPLVTEALLREGFNDEEIALIMGGNVVRVLLSALP